MALKMRMARGGRKKSPFYRIVVADSRAPRDGKFIEKIGTYNPLLGKEHPNRLVLNTELVKKWLAEGAEPSERVARFLGEAGLAPMPTQRKSVEKAKPKAKALERIREKEEKAAAAAEAAREAEEAAKAAEAEAAAAPAEESPSEGEAEATAEASDAPAEETAADAPAAEETPAEDDTK